MAKHQTLAELGVSEVLDFGPIGHTPPPFTFEETFGLTEISAETRPAPAPLSPARIMGFGL